MFAIPPAADLGVAGHAADRLFALVRIAAEQQIGDAFLGDDVRDVVAVDHHRRQFELQLLGEFQRIELLDEQRHVLVAEGLADLHDQLAATAQRRRAVGIGLRAGLQPGLARMAPSAGVGAHVRRAAEAGDARGGDGRGVSLQVDLQRRADEHVAGVEARRLAEGAVGAQRAVRPGEVDVGSGADVVIHADLRAEGMDLLHPAGFDRRDQRGMRIQAQSGWRPCPSGPASRRMSAAAARSRRC